MRIRKDKLRARLDQLYAMYNKRKYVAPDPLMFLYDYADVRDREVAGMVAACLAYGRVNMITRTVGDVLERMGASPRQFVLAASDVSVRKVFKGFKYRFSTEDHLTALVMGMQGGIEKYGSLEGCFSGGETPVEKSEDLVEGLGRLYREICLGGDVGHLMADPGKSSACKRSHLFLRWMIRCDGVDPGGWTGVSHEHLVYPVDTHMYKIGTMLGFTRRKAADKKCAREITTGFRRLNPQDPVKYDFALTRFGIRQPFNIEDLKAFLKKEAD